MEQSAILVLGIGSLKGVNEVANVDIVIFALKAK